MAADEHALPGGTEAEWRALVRREPKEANIGPGRKYKTRAAYEDARVEWMREKAVRDALAPERERAQAALRESRRTRDRGGLLPSGAAGRQKRKAASRSALALSLIEDGCPELADLVDANDYGQTELETMDAWAEDELGIEPGELNDEHIPQWRASSDYHRFRRALPARPSPSHPLPISRQMRDVSFRLSMCHTPLCKIEKVAFERWAESRGGLKGSRGRSIYTHLKQMHERWRESSEFCAWLPEHESQCVGEFRGCGPSEDFGWPRVSLEAYKKAVLAEVRTCPCNVMCTSA